MGDLSLENKMLANLKTGDIAHKHTNQLSIMVDDQDSNLILSEIKALGTSSITVHRNPSRTHG